MNRSGFVYRFQGFLVSFLRQLEGLIGVFHGLPGMLMSRLVVFFAVMHCGGPVRMCGHLVELSRPLM